MKLEIEEISNGFIITQHDTDLDTGEDYIQQECISENEDVSDVENADLLDDSEKAGLNLLFKVMEHFGFSGSKHNDARINISVDRREG